MLAGDTLRSSADLRVPTVGVTLLSRKGYFHQSISADGRQGEAPELWKPADVLERLPVTIQVEIEGRSVRVQPWRTNVTGLDGYIVPVLLLDTDVAGNRDDDRAITDQLYGGDERYRLSQEIVLGIGGVRALRALGYAGLRKFHMNEGHASLLVLELLREIHGGGATEWDFEAVRKLCVFTTHTPVPAGHDRFDHGLVDRLLGPSAPAELVHMLGGEGALNMTLLALNMSQFVNGVARRHGEVSREMFPGYPIHHVTNGVHSRTWTAPPFRSLYDRWIPGWSNDPAMLRHALQISRSEVWEALAHPRDEGGKEAIRRVIAAGRRLEPRVHLVYRENYDVDLAGLLVSGVDLWLNTPRPPLEASGTSGMKAAHNGVPSLSTLDGWWPEGLVEGLTGWSIGSQDGAVPDEDAAHVSALYEKLEREILPRFFGERQEWIDVMRHTIALNASYFNTHRMVQQYVTNAYVA